MAKKKASKKKTASKKAPTSKKSSKKPGKKRMTKKEAVEKLQGPNVKRLQDGTRIIKTEFGEARITRTPKVNVAAGDWTLHVNGTFQNTFDTDSEAISHAKEILSRPLVNKVIVEDISTGNEL